MKTRLDERRKVKASEGENAKDRDDINAGWSREVRAGPAALIISWVSVPGSVLAGRSRPWRAWPDSKVGACECRQQRARQEADADVSLGVGLGWGMCMGSRSKQDPEAGVKGMSTEGSKGLARLFCSSAGGVEGRLNLGEKGTAEWYRGHPPTRETRKRPHVFFWPCRRG